MVNGGRWPLRWILERKDRDKPFKIQGRERNTSKAIKQKKPNEYIPLGIYSKDKKNCNKKLRLFLAIILLVEI